MTDREDPPSLESVEARLAAHRAQRENERIAHERRRVSGAAQSTGFRIVAELIAALIVGGALGYGIDQWLGTGPWFMVAMVFLGFAAALMNIYRIVKGLDQAVGLGRAMREADDKQNRDRTNR